jgi:hypothetical protein
MNSLNPFPQILPPPKFPVPETSRIARKLAASIINGYQMRSGDNQVLRLWKLNHSGGMLVYKRIRIAIYLYDVHTSPRKFFLYLRELEGEGVPKAILFDRFNAVLKTLQLPTLHEVVKGYWIFSDGAPWNGQRLISGQEKPYMTEKEKFQNYVLSHP